MIMIYFTTCAIYVYRYVYNIYVCIGIREISMQCHCVRISVCIRKHDNDKLRERNTRMQECKM